MSIARLVTGRKRESNIWNHFEFLPDKGKSKCLIITKNQKTCGIELAGKNPTNLKAHVKTTHPEVFKEFQTTDAERKTSKKQKIEESACGKSQPTVLQVLDKKGGNFKGPTDSVEHSSRTQAILSWIIASGCPMHYVHLPEFRNMLLTCDKKFQVPGSAVLQKELKKTFESQTQALKEKLKIARKATICIDCWTKKGLTVSYLGISACFFDPTTANTYHATLDIKEVSHPHTGEMIARVVTHCLEEWGLGREKILLVISDNGANMLKALKVIQGNARSTANEVEADEHNDDNAEGGDNENNTNSNDGLVPQRSEEECVVLSNEEREANAVGMEIDENDIESETDDDLNNDDEGDYFLSEIHMPYRHMPCLAHTIQLLIKPVFKAHYDSVLTSARKLISTIRKSSVMTQELLKACGKTLIIDCPTRWNSTFYMDERLLQIRPWVEEVLAKNKHDSLRNSEWDRLSELQSLLRPFVEQTNTLQTDGKSLSLVLPALLNLEEHIEMFTVKSTSRSLLQDFKVRFAQYLQPRDANFNPLASAACLLNPTVAVVLLTPDMAVLQEAARRFILTLADDLQRAWPQQHTTNSNDDTDSGASTSSQTVAGDNEKVSLQLQKFPFLFKKVASFQSRARAAMSVTSRSSSSDLQAELTRYIRELEDVCVNDAFKFWRDRRIIYPSLAPIAEDLLAAPASEAYVERIFSLTGYLSSGKRNRMTKSLAMRSFLKLNRAIFV